MGVTAAVVAIAASAVSAYGQIKQGEDQKKAADYNAAVANNNAIAARQKAEFEAKAHEDKLKSLLSSQRAAYGASGVETGSGSPLLTLQDTAGKGELDRLAILYGGEIQAQKDESQAGMFKWQGKNARTAGYIGAGGTLLQGASTAYGMGSKPSIPSKTGVVG